MYNPDDICVCRIPRRPNNSWHVFHSNWFDDSLKTSSQVLTWISPDHWAPIVAGYRSSIPHAGNSLQEIAGHHCLQIITGIFGPFSSGAVPILVFLRNKACTFPVVLPSIQILLNTSANTAYSLPQGLNSSIPTPRVKSDDIYIIQWGIGNLKILSNVRRSYYLEVGVRHLYNTLVFEWHRFEDNCFIATRTSYK